MSSGTADGKKQRPRETRANVCRAVHTIHTISSVIKQERTKDEILMAGLAIGGGGYIKQPIAREDKA